MQMTPPNSRFENPNRQQQLIIVLDGELLLDGQGREVRRISPKRATCCMNRYDCRPFLMTVVRDWTVTIAETSGCMLGMQGLERKTC
jgi:hypothetical protein